MRINFHSRYEDIQRILNPKSGATNVAGEGNRFEQTLDLIDGTNRSQIKQLSDSDGLASLAPKTVFPIPFEELPPTLEQPRFQPLQPPPVPVEEVKEAPIGVKTPTIVSVARVELGTADSAGQIPQLGATTTGTKTALEQVIRAAGISSGIDPELTLAVVKHESSFNARAVSSDGHASKGLFQLLDSTGKEMQERLGIEGEYEPFDPEFNSKLGTGYLRYLHDLFNDDNQLGNNYSTRKAADSASLEKFAVAAFNAGEGRVAAAQSMSAKRGGDPSIYEQVEHYLPKSTQQYVNRVISSKLKSARN